VLQKSHLILILALILVVSIAVLGVTGTQREIWSGYYPFLECEFHFRDSSGKPIQGISLRVKRQTGFSSYYLPIDDYYPGHIPTSDAAGMLRFHYCGHSFGGTMQTYFHFIQIGNYEPPACMCYFVYKNEIIHSVDFNAFVSSADLSGLPSVKRTLSLPIEYQLVKSPTPPTPSELSETEYQFSRIQWTVVLD